MAVEFISHGYDSTATNPYTENVWFDAFPAIGSATYAVRGEADWRVTAVAGLDRTVRIAAGRGLGHGVTDETEANDTIQLDPVSSGSRWDLIACRRDWTPTAGVSQFVKVNGGTTAVVPGNRLVGPGIDDQPLALVRCTAGQSLPQEIIDLRTWVGDGGGLAANHDLVRTFMSEAGTRINISGVDWLRRVGSNGTAEWITMGEAGKTSLYGTGPALLGAAPASGEFLVQAGTQVSITDPSGFDRLTFPKPFPGGLLYVGLTNGDGFAGGAGSTFSAAGNANHWGQSGGGSKTDLVYEMCLANGSRALNRQHRVNWIAIGW